MTGTTPMVAVSHLVKRFTRGGLLGRRTSVTAVNDVSFSIREGETFGLVGESGSGKTTTGRCILRLIEPTSGSIVFRGDDVLAFPRRRLRAARRDMQIVFQDPYSSLNPRMRARRIVEEPLVIHRLGDQRARRERVAELFQLVGLDPAHLERYPHQFSGGQRQRISIARAMALEPDLIIADEAVSSLDVSVRAQILNLFRRLQESRSLSYLFIAHDLSVVEHFCERVAVMYGGKIVEIAAVDELFNAPLHPYTEALISAIPEPDPRIPYRPRILKGEVVNLINRPPGCVFQNRCPIAQRLCSETEPPLEEKRPAHWAACHFH